MDPSAGRLGSLTIAVATAIGIVAFVLPFFLNPVWVAVEQDRAQAGAWTGFAPPELRFVTDAILADLIVGPPDFDVALGSDPVLNERERAHMRDVRAVFIGFFAIALVAVALAVVIAARRRGSARGASWRAVRRGALALILVLLIVGAVSFLAFDTLFEVFHRLFFAGGSYTFDPATDRLVQLFPFRFWQESAIAVGILAIGLAGVVAILASGRSR